MWYTAVLCRVLLGFVFAASAFAKLRGRAAFAGFTKGLAAMRVVPERGLRELAGVVAVTEAVVPVLLLAPGTVRLGLGLAVLLLSAFTLAVGVVLRRGTVASCPCFGAAQAPFGVRHVVRNTVLTGVAAAGLATVGGGASGQGAGVLLAVLAGAVLASLVIRLDDLVALFRLSG
ncbi:MauE/DoxX family redox-associated membrane protein [Streptomyces sp. NPDC049099]|uniref:MauE/DoxX family redox-associated membrane protein n=1 Tax=Streptomyces sp. NPDC049099 TaxID=3155768 RepID=UPI00341A5922